MRVLVLNAGSSSLKGSLVEEPGDRTLDRLTLVPPSQDGWTDALRNAVEAAGRMDAVGYRVVHGGDRHRTPLLIDASVIAELDALRDLAPLHNRPALEVIAAAQAALPDLSRFEAASPVGAAAGRVGN